MRNSWKNSKPQATTSLMFLQWVDNEIISYDLRSDISRDLFYAQWIISVLFHNVHSLIGAANLSRTSVYLGKSCQPDNGLTRNDDFQWVLPKVGHISLLGIMILICRRYQQYQQPVHDFTSMNWSSAPKNLNAFSLSRSFRKNTVLKLNWLYWLLIATS
jgi:hypothetical protein